MLYIMWFDYSLNELTSIAVPKEIELLCEKTREIGKRRAEMKTDSFEKIVEKETQSKKEKYKMLNDHVVD